MAIYRYVTEGSFDAYMWQALETKARFIAQVMTGESAVRRAEDIGGQELILRRGQGDRLRQPGGADPRRGRRRIAAAGGPEEEPRRRAVPGPAEYPRAAGDHRPPDQARRRPDAGPATLAGHADDPITIGDHAYAEEDAAKPLARRLNSIPDHVHETRRYPLGVYRGLEFGIVVNPLGAPDAYLEGATTRHTMIARDAGPRAVLNALDRLADGYEGQIATARERSGDRRRPAPRLPGPPGQAVRPRRLPGRTHRPPRPAQGGTIRGDGGGGGAAAPAGRRDRRPHQGPEIRPHHRARPGADQGPQRRQGRGAGHRPHPPPDRGIAPPRCGGRSRDLRIALRSRPRPTRPPRRTSPRRPRRG